MDARGSQNAGPDDGPDKGPGESMSNYPVDVSAEGEAQGLHRNADLILAECETRYVPSSSVTDTTHDVHSMAVLNLKGVIAKLG